MTPSSSGGRGRAGCRGEVAEWSPAVCVDPGLSNCNTHVTEVIQQDEAEN